MGHIHKKTTRDFNVSQQVNANKICHNSVTTTPVLPSFQPFSTDSLFLQNVHWTASHVTSHLEPFVARQIRNRQVVSSNLTIGSRLPSCQARVFS